MVLHLAAENGFQDESEITKSESKRNKKKLPKIAKTSWVDLDSKVTCSIAIKSDFLHSFIFLNAVQINSFQNLTWSSGACCPLSPLHLLT